MPFPDHDVTFPWRSKLNRAEHHLLAFKELCAAYEDSVRLLATSDPASGIVTVTLDAPEPPVQMGLVLGDVLHNLRSALDCITVEACVRAGASPEAKIYFPITAEEANWKKERRNSSRPLLPCSVATAAAV